MKLPALVDGGGGNDSIAGGGGNFIALGGDGNDCITGGSNFNLLIGGNGADRLTATGCKGTILIGARTDFDDVGTCVPNKTALDAIMAEWSSGDMYANRVNAIVGNPVGIQNPNDPYYLNCLNIHSDKSKDTLNGGCCSTGMNLFFAHTNSTKDVILGKKKSESLFWNYG